MVSIIWTQLGRDLGSFITTWIVNANVEHRMHFFILPRKKGEKKWNKICRWRSLQCTCIVFLYFQHMFWKLFMERSFRLVLKCCVNFSCMNLAFAIYCMNYITYKHWKHLWWSINNISVLVVKDTWNVKRWKWGYLFYQYLLYKPYEFVPINTTSKHHFTWQWMHYYVSPT